MRYCGSWRRCLRRICPAFLVLVVGCGAELVSASDKAKDACSLAGHAVDPDKPREEGLADLRSAAALAKTASDWDDKYGELAAALEHMVSAIDAQDLTRFEISSGIVFDNCLTIEEE